MKFMEIVEESINVLKSNQLRTGLSALGIIIGTGAVIALMTLGKASQASVEERIQSLGSNLLTVVSGTDTHGFLRSSGSGTSLTYDDMLAIQSSDRFTTIDKVAAAYSSNSQVSAEGNNDNFQIMGVTEDYFSLSNVDLVSGELIDESDISKISKVAVITSDGVETLFGENANPVGQKVRISGTPFTIIGIADPASSFGSSNNLYIPLTTAQNTLYGVNYVSTIYVSAKNAELMDEAENQLGFFLLERHGLSTPDDADFSISNQADILETVEEVTGTFTMLLTGIAAISLLVGGIGIMNIMFVTVTERTREIGIRKALGAKSKTITNQFLVEAIILTIVGGIIGAVAGIASSYFLTRAMDMSYVFSPQAVLLAFGVSVIIGVIFGWYPARKASKLPPIEALRYE